MPPVAKVTTSLISMCLTCHSHFVSGSQRASTSAWRKKRKKERKKEGKRKKEIKTRQMTLETVLFKGFFLFSFE